MPDTTQSAQPDHPAIEKLAGDVRHLFGQVVLISELHLAILHGVGLNDFGLYYIAGTTGRNKDALWYSAAGRCIGLKAYLPGDVYARLLDNHDVIATKPSEFQMLVHEIGKDPVPYDPALHSQV